MTLAPRPSPLAPRFDATRLRRTIIEMSFAGSTVHVPCAFSIVEILAVLYRSYLRLDAKDPRAPDRDYLVLSKGHGVMAQYACLNELGWISDTELRAYFGDGTRLKGLADAHVPGIEATAGSLGHGLSVAVGLAMAAKRRRSRQRVFAIVGDGEANEGAIWEAILFAAHAELSNLILIIDANGMQAMGSTAEVMNLGSLVEKLTAFGLVACDVDGHDEGALATALDTLLADPLPRPKALVARTVKGKGVSFMEHNNRWHYTRLTPETHSAAMAELQTS
ncbi:MAG TPA: transketolase [Pirellulales bacterium]|nr:transketolase [Pirellulales bacterium]